MVGMVIFEPMMSSSGVLAETGFQKPKESLWATKNKYAYQPKTYAPRQSLTSCFVLKNNSSGKMVAKYVGKETNIYRNTSIWVPKFLVTNMQGPKSNRGPKSSN